MYMYIYIYIHICYNIYVYITHIALNPGCSGGARGEGFATCSLCFRGGARVRAHVWRPKL